VSTRHVPKAVGKPALDNDNHSTNLGETDAPVAKTARGKKVCYLLKRKARNTPGLGNFQILLLLSVYLIIL
jgi:hypothetical protein